MRSLEALLGTEIHEYHSNHDQRRRLLRASKKLVVPDDIAEHLTYFNINSYPIGRSLQATAFRSQSSRNPLDRVRSGHFVTPEFLRALYKIPDNLVANETNMQGTVHSPKSMK